jgi:hypothetical protein
MLYVTFFLFAVYVLTRFGRVISASRAIPMWIVLTALGVIVVNPNLPLPVARLFGIQVISNLVFATMILFLFFESLKAAAEQTGSTRKLRMLVARLAMRDFKGSGQATALVVVPAYNEEDSIGAVLAGLAKLRETSSDLTIDVVVVDDGSIDATHARATQHPYPGVSVVSHGVNVGVGGVLQTGFMIALGHRYEYVVQCDGDGQHPVAQIPELVRAAAEQKADLLIGSRFCAPGRSGDESSTALRRFGGWLISFALATFGRRAQVSDPTSGFRVYSRKAAALLVARMPDEYPEPEAVALCAIHGLSIQEVPVRMHARQGGESSISGGQSAVFMVKVMTSLLSFRVRHAFGRSG